MRGFGFIGAIGVVVLLFIAGAIGFGLGQNTVPVAAPVAGAPVVYYGHPAFFGFGFLGFFLFLFLIFGVISLFRRAAWGHRGWGHGYYGHGMYGRGWDKGNWDKSSSGNPPMPPFADEMLGRWHQEAHGQASGAQPASQPTQSAQSADNKPDSQG